VVYPLSESSTYERLQRMSARVALLVVGAPAVVCLVVAIRLPGCRAQESPSSPATSTARIPLPEVSKDVVSKNLAACQEVISRFERLALPSDRVAADVFHGILACGPLLRLIDRQTRDTVPVSAYCRRWFAPFSTPQPLKYMDASLGKEGHAAQFVYCYMEGHRLVGGAAQAHPDRPLLAACQYEKRECHGMMDLAWFVPAFCLSGDTEPFSNRFGERIDANYLVRYLVQQSRTPLDEQPCHGTHNLYALGMARRYLASKVSGQVFAELDAEWNGRLNGVLGAIGPSGDFDVRSFLAVEGPSPGWYRLTYPGVTGHVIIALVAGGDTELLRAEPLHLLVSSTIKHCLSEDVWPSAGQWLNDGSAVGRRYIAMAHVVYGFRLYREAVEDLWPDLSGPTQLGAREARNGPSRRTASGPTRRP